MKNRKAFTLAEVLVTLAVIGVVAALTIPALTQSYEKQAWITGYKTAYSILESATGMMLAENGGTIDLSRWNNTQEMYEEYVPYLNTVKKCEDMDSRGECFGASYTNLNGDAVTVGPNNLFDATTYSITLSNGISIGFTRVGVHLMFLTDSNGKSGPNVLGKDLQVIYIKDNQLVHFKSLLALCLSETSITAECPSDLSSGTGYCCSTRIMRGDY